MIAALLTGLIAGCQGVSDNGLGVYTVLLQDGSTRQATPGEIQAAEAAYQAQLAAGAQAAADRSELREQFQAAHDRLVQIRDGANPTNAQVIKGVRDIAGYQIKILRALYGILTD